VFAFHATLCDIKQPTLLHHGERLELSPHLPELNEDSSESRDHCGNRRVCHTLHLSSKSMDSADIFPWRHLRHYIFLRLTLLLDPGDSKRIQIRRLSSRLTALSFNLFLKKTLQVRVKLRRILDAAQMT